MPMVDLSRISCKWTPIFRRLIRVIFIQKTTHGSCIHRRGFYPQKAYQDSYIHRRPLRSLLSLGDLSRDLGDVPEGLLSLEDPPRDFYMQKTPKYHLALGDLSRVFYLLETLIGLETSSMDGRRLEKCSICKRPLKGHLSSEGFSWDFYSQKNSQGSSINRKILKGLLFIKDL